MTDALTPFRSLDGFLAHFKSPERLRQQFAPTRWCAACQAETTTDHVCPMCEGAVGDDSLCPVCREAVAPHELCHGCGTERMPEAVELLAAENHRLARSREDLANRLQAVQLLVQIMDDNPNLSVRVACQHAGVDYDTHILNRR